MARLPSQHVSRSHQFHTDSLQTQNGGWGVPRPCSFSKSQYSRASLLKKDKTFLDSFQSNAFGIGLYSDNWPNYCVQICCSGLPGSFYGPALHDCIMIDFCPALTSNHISYDHVLEINKSCCKMCGEGPAHMSRYKSTGISILSMSIGLSGCVSCFSGCITSEWHHCW